MLSVLYVYFNTPEELLDSTNSIKRAINSFPYEIVIVDNASTKKLPKLNSRISVKLIINTDNQGYGKAMNQAAKAAKGDILLIANTDTIFTENSIKLITERIKKNERIGVIGPQMISKSGRVLQSYNGQPFLPDALFAFSFINSFFPNNKFSKRYWLGDMDTKKENEVGFVGGACMVIKKSVFERAGGFDERFFMYFEEADICFRIKKLGYKILYFPDARVIHLIGRSTKDNKWIKKTFEESRFKFFQKYHGNLMAIMGECILRIMNFPIKKYITT